ncbi:MAG TPA: Maf family protein [Chloroflexota bacterium]|nr:Maf family protein [Chloroflexota bacterium]
MSDAGARDRVPGDRSVTSLILASGSPRREALMRQVGLQFEVEPSDAEESLPEGMTAEESARQLALKKARQVAARRIEGLVIGADTVVVVDGQILGKPSGPDEARDMIRRLSGREHQVITGIAVVDAATADSRSDSVSTDVRFAPLSQEVIDRYVATGEPLDKAGGYGIQGFAALLVESIRGDYNNVVGLPIRRLAELLGEFGYDAFKMGLG